jgi:tetratricopeptide (TPR) repeat protein
MRQDGAPPRPQLRRPAGGGRQPPLAGGRRDVRSAAADEGRRQCEQILAESRGRLLVEAAGRAGIALADAAQGRFEDARGQIAASRSIYKDLGQRPDYGGTSHLEGEIELLAGDAEAAERVLREGFELLESIGVTGYLSTVAACLAEAIYRQKRYEEAERFSEVSEQAAAPGDLVSQVGWRSTRASVLAQRGEAEKAEDLAREAVDIARRTDHLNLHASALLALADVLAIGGRPAQAIPIIEEARVLYDRKGNLVMAEMARTLPAELREGSRPSRRRQTGHQGAPACSRSRAELRRSFLLRPAPNSRPC